jgi:transposase
MLKEEGVMEIRILHRQGLIIRAIAKQLCIARKRFTL